MFVGHLSTVNNINSTFLNSSWKLLISSAFYPWSKTYIIRDNKAQWDEASPTRNHLYYTCNMKFIIPRFERYGGGGGYNTFVCLFIILSVHLFITNTSVAFFSATISTIFWRWLKFLHSLFRYVIFWDLFMYYSEVNFLVNDDLAYFKLKLC